MVSGFTDVDSFLKLKQVIRTEKNNVRDYKHDMIVGSQHAGPIFSETYVNIQPLLY